MRQKVREARITISSALRPRQEKMKGLRHFESPTAYKDRSDSDVKRYHTTVLVEEDRPFPGGLAKRALKRTALIHSEIAE